MFFFDAYRYLLNIFLWEKMWEGAWQMVNELNINLWHMNQIDEILMQGGKEHVFKYYEEQVMLELMRVSNKEHYQKVVQGIRRIHELGGKQTVARLLDELNRKYAKRKSLIEVLRQLERELF